MKVWDYSKLGGLRPQAWLCIGEGYAREEVKRLLLAQIGAFTSEAVTDTSEIARRILVASGVVSASNDRVLAAQSRQEVLRMLLSEPRISRQMLELKRLRRQAAFFKRLDECLQAGRSVAAHDEEAAVFDERLAATVGASALRGEIGALAQAYEAWLLGSGFWDPPLLIKKAGEILESGWPEHLGRPETIVRLTATADEGLEKHFWEQLSRYVAVPPRSEESEAPESELLGHEWKWERWHTLDDAADALAAHLVTELSATASAAQRVFGERAILIPDHPAVRRSLMRALTERGIVLADPRDPTRLRVDEWVKACLLPLDLAGADFERTRVFSYISFLKKLDPERVPDEVAVQWCKEIAAHGIRRGLSAYSGEKLQVLARQLEELKVRFSGRMKVDELSERHLDWLKQCSAILPEMMPWVSFFESLWGQLTEDLKMVEGETRRSAPLLWLQRLRMRLSEVSPPVEKLKPEAGLRVFRLVQAPLFENNLKLVCFGLPPGWLSGEVSDYWYNSREREILASEFAVRSGRIVAEERLQILKQWIAASGEVSFYDADYAEDGRERESLGALLKTLGCPLEQAEVKGSFARWSESYRAARPVPELAVALSPIAPKLEGQKRELTATVLDRYSRCPFQALAHQRWRLWDLKEPDFELWPEVRGTLLHEAVKVLLRSRDPEGRFTLQPLEAISRVWAEKPPKGFFRSQRAEEYEKSRAAVVLEAFCLAENEYFARARTQTVSLEELRLRCEFPDFILIGEPDRIEEHPDGFFVSDFKTSSGLPNGAEMVEQGYRLQLPFYAIGLQKQTGTPVIGVQFIELTRKGTRSSGIFFEKWNGKDPGKLTKVRSNAKSLLGDEPESVWARVEQKVIEAALGYLNGKYAVAPKKESECRSCQAADLCGARRLAASGRSVVTEEEASE